MTTLNVLHETRGTPHHVGLEEICYLEHVSHKYSAIYASFKHHTYHKTTFSIAHLFL